MIHVKDALRKRNVLNSASQHSVKAPETWDLVVMLPGGEDVPVVLRMQGTSFQVPMIGV